MEKIDQENTKIIPFEGTKKDQDAFFIITDIIKKADNPSTVMGLVTTYLMNQYIISSIEHGLTRVESKEKLRKIYENYVDIADLNI